MKKFNLLYKGDKIYTNLTVEDYSEILQDFAERFYSGEDINPNEIEMEEILNV
jgi:NOL1/NOP2/fmu family ribosome biogenesis protein